ncbi:MAG TPA: type II toxin-antitoxin system Phd/YefM family antitoxin [Aliidiomarina sp.]|nr:type II toxin-antitoxin system Phd/YefM family antitoxin [Aliidiomarina sp.]
MLRVRVDEDIRPLSEFRAGVATFVKQIHETRRPMVLTQRGRGVAVLVNVQEYERMQARLELLEEIYKAEEQLANGEGISHNEAKSRVLGRLA